MKIYRFVGTILTLPAYGLPAASRTDAAYRRAGAIAAPTLASTPTRIIPTRMRPAIGVIVNGAGAQRPDRSVV